MGELEVTKITSRELKVASKTESWQYNGEAHTAYEYQVTFGDEQKTVRIAEGETTGTVELSTGDTVTITPGPAAVITHVAENDVDNAFSWTVENDAFYTKGEDMILPRW